jgi:hypothetical protein
MKGLHGPNETKINIPENCQSRFANITLFLRYIVSAATRTAISVQNPVILQAFTQSPDKVYCNTLKETTFTS